MQRLAHYFSKYGHSRPFITGATLVLALAIFVSGLIYQGVKQSPQASSSGPYSLTVSFGNHGGGAAHSYYASWSPRALEVNAFGLTPPLLSCKRGANDACSSVIANTIVTCAATGTTRDCVNTKTGGRAAFTPQPKPLCTPTLESGFGKCSAPYHDGTVDCRVEDHPELNYIYWECSASWTKFNPLVSPTPKPNASPTSTRSPNPTPFVYLYLQGPNNEELAFSTVEEADCPNALSKRGSNFKDGKPTTIVCSYRNTDTGTYEFNAKASSGGKVTPQTQTIPATGTLTVTLKVGAAECRVASSTIWPFSLISRAKAQENCGVIEGVVTDKDGKKIEGAQVAAIPFQEDKRFTATTDKDGHYKIINLPTNSYAVFAVIPLPQQAKSKSKIIEVSNQTVTADLVVIARGLIRGTVIEEGTNKPIKEAFVTLTHRDKDGKILDKDTIITEQNGEYKFDDLPVNDVFSLEAGGDEYIDDSTGILSVVPRPGPEGEVVNFRLFKAGYIFGTVTDTFGTVMARIPVNATVKNADGNLVLKSDITDDSGSYSFEGLDPSNEYELIIFETEQYDELRRAGVKATYPKPGTKLDLRLASFGTITQKFHWRKNQTIPNPPWSCRYPLCTGTVKQVLDLVFKGSQKKPPIGAQVKAVLKVPNAQDGFTTVIYKKSNSDPIGTIIQKFKRPSAPDPFTSEGESESLKADTYMLETKMNGWICLTIKEKPTSQPVTYSIATDVIFTTNNVEVKPGEKKVLPTQGFSGYKLRPHDGLTSESKC